MQPVKLGAEQSLELACELYQVQELFALWVKSFKVRSTREQLAEGSLFVKLCLRDGDDFQVGEVAAEDARGHF